MATVQDTVEIQVKDTPEMDQEYNMAMEALNSSHKLHVE